MFGKRVDGFVGFKTNMGRNVLKMEVAIIGGSCIKVSLIC
jgi:hypothetical protein